MTPATMVVLLTVGLLVLMGVLVLKGSWGTAGPRIICVQKGCGQANPREARFCSRCGHVLGSGDGRPVVSSAFMQTAKSGFRVVLLDADKKRKILVIKALRRGRSDLGLKEAKDLVDAVPQIIGLCATRQEAEQWQAELQEAGAVVNIEAWKAPEKETPDGESNNA